MPDRVLTWGKACSGVPGRRRGPGCDSCDTCVAWRWGSLSGRSCRGSVPAYRPRLAWSCQGSWTKDSSQSVCYCYRPQPLFTSSLLLNMEGFCIYVFLNFLNSECYTGWLQTFLFWGVLQKKKCNCWSVWWKMTVKNSAYTQQHLFVCR